MLAELEATRRAIRVRIAGDERWLAIEDAGRVRDALGAAAAGRRARGVHRAGARPARRPGGPLRAHPRPVPRSTQVGARLGLGSAVVAAALERLRARRPGRAGRVPPRRAGQRVVRREVLRTIRRRSLAALRREVEPVSTQALARFLPELAGRRRPRHPARGLGRPAAHRRATGRRAGRRPARSSRWSCRRGSPTTPRRCSTS